MLMRVSSAMSAGNSFVLFQTVYGQFKIPAIEKKGRISVDILKLSEALGAGTRISNGIYVMQFSSETVKINPATNIFSVKQFKESQWKHVQLKHKGLLDGDRLFITLETLPSLFNQSFTYHLQRRLLAVGNSVKPAEVKGYKNITVRYILKDQKVWLSVEDLAKSMGIIMYSLRVRAYSLVLPDFTILDIVVGQQTLLRRRQPYRQLNDPVLAFGGAPYVTIQSVPTLFEMDVRWDSASHTVLVPSDYGRIRNVQVVDTPHLEVIGYRPEPLSINVNEFSAYYQEPGPTYVSSNYQPYESVRDPIDNRTLPRAEEGFNKFSGHAVAEMKGSLAQAPFDARGSFEKVGSNGRLVNGGFSWGFPKLRLEAGREYLTFNGLHEQFVLTDQVAISHSNDSYGEGKVNPNWQIKALYGESDFNIYSTTYQYFGSLVTGRQKIANGSLGATVKMSPRQTLSLKLDHYQFSNEILRIESAIINLETRDLLILIGQPADVNPDEELALARSLVSDHHSTSVSDLTYSFKNVLELQGIAAFSNYRDDNEKSINDTDWKVRTALGGKDEHLEMSYENVGKRYRSVGNPLDYQGRSIIRFSPYLTFTKWWRFFGELRNENILNNEALDYGDQKVRYMFGSNIFNFRSNVIRLTANEYKATLYGKRSVGNLDLTQYLGPHSIDVGVGGMRQYFSTGELYRRSSIGRASFTLLKPNWKFQLGEEYTHHTYVTLNNETRYESLSNLLFEYKKFRSLLQYEIQPLYSTLPDYLHTGYIRMGFEVGEKRYLDFFASKAGYRRNLADPEVWRVGLEYSADLF